VGPGHDRLDPGLGFANGAEHNWELLTHLMRSARSAGRARRPGC